MIKKPKVNIVTICYNQRKYIRQTLDSFINQQVNFKFQIIIADDCSTDGTQDIIKEYVEKFPKIFIPILRKSNIGAQKNCIDALQRATADYIALCEGDDYWTDYTKLQKQVDFLDKNKDYALSFHRVKVKFENNKREDSTFPLSIQPSNTITKELLKHNYIQTNSVVYRRQDYSNIPIDVLPLDWYLHLYHAQFGKIGFIKDIMSVYRVHSMGMWYESKKDIKKIWRKYGIQHLLLYEELLKLYGNDEELKAIIIVNANMMMSNIALLPNNANNETLNEAIKRFPDFTKFFMADMSVKVEDLEAENNRIVGELKQYKNNLVELKALNTTLNKHCDEIQVHLQGVEAKLANVEAKLDLIHSSRVWKIRNKLASLFGNDGA